MTTLEGFNSGRESDHAQLDLTASEDQMVEAAVMALRGALAEQGAYRLVLVCDPTIGDPLRSEIEEAKLPIWRIQIPKSLAVADAPYLVEIEDERKTEGFVNASLRLAVEQALRPALPTKRVRSVCAWLFTQETLPQLAHAFSQRMRLRDPSGASKVLRFWDPRVTQHVAEIFPRIPAQSWMPGSAWGYIDAFGRWELLPAGEPDDVPFYPEGGAVSHVSLLNQVQQFLTADGTRYSPEVLVKIKEALQQSRSLGLIRDEDLVHFALHRVRLDAPIECSSLIREAAEEVTSSGGYLARVIESFDDEDWRAILHSAKTSTKGQGERP